MDLLDSLKGAKKLGEHSWLLDDVQYGKVVIRELTGISFADAKNRYNELCASEVPGVAAPLLLKQVGERIFVYRTWIEGQALKPLITPEKAAEIVALLAALPSEFVIYDFCPEHLIETSKGLLLCDPGWQEIGRAPYAAPEQYGRGSVEANAVDYQLGVTLAYLLSGDLPADALSLLIPDAEPPEIKQLPDSLARKVTLLFEADPDLRPVPAELLADFTSWLEFRKRSAECSQDLSRDLPGSSMPTTHRQRRPDYRHLNEPRREEAARQSQTEVSPLNENEAPTEPQIPDKIDIADLVGKVTFTKQVKSSRPFKWDWTVAAVVVLPLLVASAAGVWIGKQGLFSELDAKKNVAAVIDQNQPTVSYLPSSWVSPKDNAKMILIPAGRFYEGPRPEAGPGAEALITELPAFYIDRYEVTNRQFKRFVDETGYKAEGHWQEFCTDARMNHPVIKVSYQDAEAYAHWAGKRLPTAEEWEKAARGGDMRRYPWGNTWDVTRLNCQETGLGNTAEVGSFPTGASPYGVEDMAGNVWEWVDAWHIPEGADDSQLSLERATKGGSRNDSEVACSLVSERGVIPQNGSLVNSGFRCVYDPINDGRQPVNTVKDVQPLPEPTPQQRRNTNVLPAQPPLDANGQVQPGYLFPPGSGVDYSVGEGQYNPAFDGGAPPPAQPLAPSTSAPASTNSAAKKQQPANSSAGWSGKVTGSDGRTHDLNEMFEKTTPGIPEAGQAPVRDIPKPPAQNLPKPPAQNFPVYHEAPAAAPAPAAPSQPVMKMNSEYVDPAEVNNVYGE